MKEKNPIQEFSESENELVSALREKGFEDSEVREKLIAWTQEQEAWAESVNTSRANIEVNLRRAKLCRAAGKMNEALEHLEDVRIQATQENEGDLLRETEALMDQIEQEIE